MGVPVRQAAAIGLYIIKQKLKRNRHYPLVLMLEPLFRCNLACAGCGKIDYDEDILDQRISVEDALGAIDECGAPVVNPCCIRRCRKSFAVISNGASSSVCALMPCCGKRA
jgi:hypothetical protein